MDLIMDLVLELVMEDRLREMEVIKEIRLSLSLIGE
jgi:hypothetical protein